MNQSLRLSEGIRPAPHPHLLQRARGSVDVVMGARAGQPALQRLYQSGCAKALLPRTYGAMPEAVLINTSGGLTGGDRLTYRCETARHAELCVTTQAAERVYRSSQGVAGLETRLQLGPGSRLHWLPQETILFDGGRLRRQLEVDMAEDAELIALECVALGRTAMGENLTTGLIEDLWRIRRDGRLVHAEALRLDDDLGGHPGCDLAGQIASDASVGGRRSFATLVLAAPGAHERVESIRDTIERLPGDALFGASAKPDLLILRGVAPDHAALRHALSFLLCALREADLPRVWSNG